MTKTLSAQESSFIRARLDALVSDKDVLRMKVVIPTKASIRQTLQDCKPLDPVERPGQVSTPVFGTLSVQTCKEDDNGL